MDSSLPIEHTGTFCQKQGRSPAAGPMNPFSRRDRDNFPTIDEFLAQHDDSFERMIEPSSTSPSDDGIESSIFNMSIGARAALSEHMRQIAKHGIDGESSSPEAPNTILDLEWERYHDAKGPSVHDCSRESNTSFDIHASPPSFLEPSIEVMTDVSHDYFTSARVKQLATPERNRGRTHYVSTRKGGLYDEDEDASDLSSLIPTDTIAPELLMMHLSSAAAHEYGNAHASFQSASFCEPDISRISSTDDSEPYCLKQGPNISSQMKQAVRGSVGEQGASPFFLRDRTPHFRHNFRPQQSPSSMPSPLHAEASFDHLSRSPGRSQISSMFCDARHQKENVLNNPVDTKKPFLGRKDRHMGSPSDSPPFNQETGTTHALETMSTDFMAAIACARIEGGGTLSPISMVGSLAGGALTESASFSSRKGRNFETTRARMLNHPPSIAPGTQQDSSTSSSSSSLLTGRKRFRTVVPRRVYLDSPSQFVDEQDSFGHNSDSKGNSLGSDESRLAQRSLLDSFEATIEEEAQEVGCNACYHAD